MLISFKPLIRCTETAVVHTSLVMALANREPGDFCIWSSLCGCEGNSACSGRYAMTAFMTGTWFSIF